MDARPSSRDHRTMKTQIVPLRRPVQLLLVPPAPVVPVLPPVFRYIFECRCSATTVSFRAQGSEVTDGTR